MSTSAQSAGPKVNPSHNPWKSYRITPPVFALVGLVLFLGVVQIAGAADWWSTSGKTTGGGEQVALTGSNPDEVKGWVTIKDLLATYKIPKEEFYARWNLPADLSTDKQMKDLEKINPEFSTAALREWLTQRARGSTTPAPLGTVAPSGSPTQTPQSALTQPTTTAVVQRTPLSGRTEGTPSPGAQKTPLPGETPTDIKGSTTIAEVLRTYSVPKDEFYAKWKLPSDLSSDKQLKDLSAINPDFSVTVLKTWLTERPRN